VPADTPPGESGAPTGGDSPGVPPEADDTPVLARLGELMADAAVYAPLGFALEFRNLAPRMVERGRNHVAMAKMIGQFAVRKGADDLGAGVQAGRQRLEGLLGRTGEDHDAGSTAGTTTADTPAGTPAAGHRPGARVSAEAAAEAADIDPAGLAIPDYDLLSASQVVPRLDSLTDDELDLVGRYEAGTRGRRTILAKVEQLRGSHPTPP